MKAGEYSIFWYTNVTKTHLYVSDEGSLLQENLSIVKQEETESQNLN